MEKLLERLEKTISVHAPPDQIFEFIDDPVNLLAIWPNVVDVQDVERLPGGRRNFRLTYKMCGVRLEGTVDNLIRSANERIVSRLRGGLEATVTWTLEPEDGTTRVAFEMEYNVPAPLLRKHSVREVVEQQAAATDTMLANLQSHFET